MAVWSLTCFFVSASSNKWIRALYPIKCSFVFSHYRVKTLETLDIIGGFCTHSDRLNCPWVIIVNININSAFHFFHPLNLCEEALRSQNFIILSLTVQHCEEFENTWKLRRNLDKVRVFWISLVYSAMYHFDIIVMVLLATQCVKHIGNPPFPFPNLSPSDFFRYLNEGTSGHWVDALFFCETLIVR